MTVPTTTNKTASQVMGSYTYNFTFGVLTNDPTESDAEQAIKVAINDGTTETQLTYGADYSVALNANGTGGTITVVDPKDNTYTLVIYREYEITQGSDYNDFNSMPAETLEDNLDKLTMIAQQLMEKLGRALLVDITSGVSPEGLKQRIMRIYASIDNIDIVANDKANVDTVASNIAKIDTNATNINNINTVASNIANINAVNNNKNNINAVAGNATNINAVAGNAANINAVAGNATNINAVNANKTNIDTVAGDKANIDTVAGDKTNIDAVAGNEANVSAVGAAISQVISTGNNIAAITLLNSNMSVLQYLYYNYPPIRVVYDNLQAFIVAAQHVADINAIAAMIYDSCMLWHGGFAGTIDFDEITNAGSASTNPTYILNGSDAYGVNYPNYLQAIQDVSENIQDLLAAAQYAGTAQNAASLAEDRANDCLNYYNYMVRDTEIIHGGTASA